jgi:hypothetical protein
MPKASSLDRTTKLEIDEGRAHTWEEAETITAGYRLALEVGPGIDATLTGQAALATILNAGPRAFKGGVFVRSGTDPALDLAWFSGRRQTEVIAELAGVVSVKDLPDVPRLVLGDATTLRRGDLHLTWEGWATGVVADPAERLAESRENELAGVFAGALAVSERFQAEHGSVRAGRRSVGISLWRPDLNWRDEGAVGPLLRWLPTRYWLAGLGHLGQAYSWAIGCLPYADRAEVDLLLQDIDTVEGANMSTGLLVSPEDEFDRKTRAASRRLSRLGYRTSIVERLFDAATQRRKMPPVEPGVLLTGFHDADARRFLDDRGFDLTVDGGLGGGVDGYLGIRIHRFPSHLRAADTFADRNGIRTDEIVARPAYQAELARLVAAGEPEASALCGLIEAAGRTVGAAFVGAAAGALVVADPVREVHGGERYALIDLDLRSPSHVQAIVDTSPRRPSNPGFTSRLLR